MRRPMRSQSSAGVGEQPTGHLGELAMSCGGGQPHRCSVAADVILDVPTDPADGVCSQAALEACRIEAGDGSMQAEMPGTNEIGNLDVGLPIAARDRDHELAVAFPQVGQRSLAGL